MKYINLTAVIIVFVGFINLGFSQTRFSKSQLIADLDTLYSVIYDVHPDMFAMMTQEKFEKELNTIKSNLKDSMTAFDFFVFTAPLIHDLQDGHTTLFFPDSPTDIRYNIFPFYLSINAKDTSIMVLKDLSEIEAIVPAGSRITRCNNYTDKEIVTEISKYCSGEKLTFRIAMLNNFLPLLPPIIIPVLCQDSVLKIDYELGGINHSKIVKTIPANDVKEHFISETSSNSQDEEPNYRLEINEELNTAIIRFDSFILNDYVDIFLDSTFLLIKKKSIEHLIIDLRYNGGGHSEVGNAFFQYISPVPFEQYGKTCIKISNLLKKYEPEIRDKKESMIVFEDGELIPLRKNPLRYSGKIYLLTSDYTFSSAADFAWTFHYFKMGTIVGEETGGLVVCFGDGFDIFSLNNTGLRYKVSYKKFYGYGATDENIHGVIPDIEVPAEQAMEKVLELIRTNIRGK